MGKFMNKPEARPFEALDLPDEEKKDLCRSLLAEFGATSVRERKDEIIHGCLLPFKAHTDQARNPTASLNWDSLTYKCLGCGHGGGLLWFIATCRGDESIRQSRAWLEDQIGIGVEAQDLSSILTYLDTIYDPKRPEAHPIPKMDERVLDPWLAIHPYLTEVRGVPANNIMRFKVGYAPRLPVRVSEDDNGKPVFVDSERIVIPHFWKGELVGWQSRRILDDGTPKYLSTPDLPKDTTVYNYDREATRAIVVESPMSVLAKTHLGHFEATFGADVTDRQIRLLSYHRRVIVWFDNDESGWRGTERLGEELMATSDVWVVESTWDEDSGGLSDEEVERLLAEAVPYAVWSKPKKIDIWKDSEMTLKKYGTGQGEMLGPDQQKKTAAREQEWTQEDDKALKEENDDADA